MILGRVGELGVVAIEQSGDVVSHPFALTRAQQVQRTAVIEVPVRPAQPSVGSLGAEHANGSVSHPRFVGMSCVLHRSGYAPVVPTSRDTCLGVGYESTPQIRVNAS